MRTRPNKPSDEDETKLEPHVSGPGKAFLMLGIAMVWNGVLSTYLWKIFENFNEGSPDWVLNLFIIPFVLFGIFLIILFIDALLALSNPKFQLRISPANLRLGEPFIIGWESTGSLRRLRKLQFTLEGREVATSSSGQKSITVESVFYREILFETRHPREHGSGKVKFTLPANLMHSFKAKHNQFEWHLHIDGEIHRWPDVRNKYELTIGPAGSD
jgi:hypothetical protein